MKLILYSILLLLMFSCTNRSIKSKNEVVKANTVQKAITGDSLIFRDTYYKADKKHKLGLYQEAHDLYLKCLEFSPGKNDSMQIYLYLFDTSIELEKYNDAENFMQQFVPKDRFALNDLSFLTYFASRKGDCIEAISFGERAKKEFSSRKEEHPGINRLLCKIDVELVHCYAKTKDIKNIKRILLNIDSLGHEFTTYYDGKLITIGELKKQLISE